MNFNRHSNLEGLHALLGASQWHWLNDSPEEIAERYHSYEAKQRGTELHEFAAMCIKNKRKLRGMDTLAQYVNDGIGFNMKPEVVLRYSDNCFGTADTIHFNEDESFLRIHDLKTGKIPAHMEQLEIYASLFCLEYDIRPGDIQTELRIYQNNDILVANPTAEILLPIMDKIQIADEVITKIRIEESL